MERLTVIDLAMFIGCDAYVYNDIEFERIAKIVGVVEQSESNEEYPVKVMYKITDRFHRNACYQLHEVKPILRPKSDLNQTEEAVLRQFRTFNYCEEPGDKRYSETPSSLSILLSWHIDIFDWIEKDLAIDKTKL